MPTLSIYLAKRRAEILRRWKRDEISLQQAARELHATGIPPLQAWQIVENT